MPQSRDRRPRLSAPTPIFYCKLRFLCGQTRASVPTVKHSFQSMRVLLLIQNYD
ncbi:hypothetical protein HMPREF0973_02166 [Prevotella veroralis F0319]|uniref:Uncharacterized protein n=1 Tax=Prevotella veroralis F0319 TaxID=649761 RepID=C9MRB4_9BACT|nr:hypothetical protein HMPREF0973_02166 [Prevotella veroralis F0319]